MNKKINFPIIVIASLCLVVICFFADFSDKTINNVSCNKVNTNSPYRMTKPISFSCCKKFEVIQIFDTNSVLVKELDKYYMATGRILCITSTKPHGLHLYETVQYDNSSEFSQIGEYDYRLGSGYTRTIPVIKSKD